MALIWSISMETKEYWLLTKMSKEDLVLLLAEYIKHPTIANEDRNFIRAIQDELRSRK